MSERDEILEQRKLIAELMLENAALLNDNAKLQDKCNKLQMEYDDRTPVYRAHCPKCDGTDLQYIETVDRYCDVIGATDDGVYILDPSWPPNIDDEGTNERLCCKTCEHTWHLDGRDTQGVRTEIDWADDTLMVQAY